MNFSTATVLSCKEQFDTNRGNLTSNLSALQIFREPLHELLSEVTANELPVHCRLFTRKSSWSIHRRSPAGYPNCFLEEKISFTVLGYPDLWATPVLTSADTPLFQGGSNIQTPFRSAHLSEAAFIFIWTVKTKRQNRHVSIADPKCTAPTIESDRKAILQAALLQCFTEWDVLSSRFEVFAFVRRSFRIKLLGILKL